MGRYYIVKKIHVLKNIYSYVREKERLQYELYFKKKI